MDHFNYRDGVLHCEEIPVENLAERVHTPCYVYSKRTLTDHYDRLSAAFAALDPLICFSIKSCSNLSVCRVLAGRGAGMDLVSGGELFRAIEAGVDPADCVFAGVGKPDYDIRYAIEAGLGWFNIESEAEFENIARIAGEMGRTCRGALRVNPDVDPKTHRYTTTGKKETKFGVDLERARAFFERYGDDPHCLLRGVHLHIGSPVYSTEPYAESIGKALRLIDDVGRERIEMLDLGGGFGADYTSNQSPVAADYADVIVPLLEERVKAGLKIVLEPGRTIAANGGILLIRVMYVKRSGEKTFVICDGGMNALIRPSHYGSFHFIWPVRVAAGMVPPKRAEEPDLPGLTRKDVVGPICESGDFLALDRPLPEVRRGDLLAVFSAGAYGMVMASRYNTMPLPTEVMVDGRSATLIRRRETWDELVVHERAPESVALDLVPQS